MSKLLDTLNRSITQKVLDTAITASIAILVISGSLLVYNLAN